MKAQLTFPNNSKTYPKQFLFFSWYFLFVLLLADKLRPALRNEGIFFTIFWPRAHGPGARKFHYTTPPAFLSIGNLTKKIANFFPEIVQFDRGVAL